MEEETITISRHYYDYLLKENHFLECLEIEGVDNWGGYKFAQERHEETYPNV